MLDMHDIGLEEIQRAYDPVHYAGIIPGLLESPPIAVLRECIESHTLLDGRLECPGWSCGIEGRIENGDVVLHRQTLRNAIRVDFNPGDLIRQIIVYRMHNSHQSPPEPARGGPKSGLVSQSKPCPCHTGIETRMEPAA